VVFLDGEFSQEYWWLFDRIVENRFGHWKEV
jgi:hypothetical protein